MRYLFVNGSDEVWGAEESMVVLARSLMREGHEVSLDCFSETVSEFWAREVNGNIRIVSRGPETISNVQKCWRYAFYKLPDPEPQAVIIFSHFLFPKAFVEKLRAFVTSRLTSQPIWAIDLHDNFRSWKSVINMNFFARSVDKIVSVSNFTARQLHRSCLPRVLVCTRALELEIGDRIAEKKPQSKEILNVGIVGRLDPEKNHLILGQALSLTSKPHRMIIRGKSSSYFPNYSDELLKELDAMLGKRLVYEGTVPRQEAMRGIDLLVVANAFEPMGRTVLEAMNSGVPVIVPDRGGSSELVTDLATGLMYKAEDAISLSQVIDYAADNQHEIAGFAYLARQRLFQEHNSSTYGQVIHDFISCKIINDR
jgi:glycosyltransferase involved in cell wall biosynthesis